MWCGEGAAARMATSTIVTTSWPGRRFRCWLDSLGGPPEYRDDIVIAVDEATADVVDHAYRGRRPGPVRIVARPARTMRGHRRVEVTVRDRGGWQPTPADPGYRGRGLAMMRVLMHRVDPRRLAEGTEIVLRSPAVDLP